MDENLFTADVKFLASLPTRMPGTAGYVQAAEYIRSQIGLLSTAQISALTHAQYLILAG